MVFKNHEIESLGRLLYGLSLKGKDSRMRTRFVNLLNAHLNDVISVERDALIEQYAEKDIDGNLVKLKDDDSQIKLVEETSQEFFEELNVLMNEEFHIEENESNKMMISSVAEIMLNGDFEVSGDIGELYDKWCEQFESVIASSEDIQV